MNERIRELEDQCWVKVPCDFDMNAGGLSTIRTVFDRKKFAELLIRECIDKCEFVGNMATITNTGEMARKTKATADSCATMIKEHFGVK